MSGVYTEENGLYRIDLRAAVWSSGSLNDAYKVIGHTLSAVDFIAETDNAIYLIEYKNTKIENAVNPRAFEEKISNGKLYSSIARKYYGGMFYLFACEKRKPVHYIAIIESELMEDIVLRKRATASIKRKLPFNLQTQTEITNSLIDGFKICSISEWNNDFPMFPIEKML